MHEYNLEMNKYIYSLGTSDCFLLVDCTIKKMVTPMIKWLITFLTSFFTSPKALKIYFSQENSFTAPCKHHDSPMICNQTFLWIFIF